MARIYQDNEFGLFFENLKLPHLVHLNNIANNDKRQLKTIHFGFLGRNEGEPGSCQIFCNARHWGNGRCNIKTNFMRVVTLWQRSNNTTNYLVCWNLTVVSSAPQIVNKMKSLFFKEKLLEKYKSLAYNSAPFNSAPSSKMDNMNHNEDFHTNY